MNNPCYYCKGQIADDMDGETWIQGGILLHAHTSCYSEHARSTFLRGRRYAPMIIFSDDEDEYAQGTSEDLNPSEGSK